MMTTSAARGRGHARDSEADVETRVYVRPARQWERLMVLQIMKGLDPGPAGPREDGPPRQLARAVAPPRPNVFLTRLASDAPPPWSTVATREVRAREAPPRTSRVSSSRLEETVVHGRRPPRAPRRATLPLLLFVMYFLIAFGVGKDRTLRGETAAQLRAATAVSASALQSSAIRLWRLVSRIEM